MNKIDFKKYENELSNIHSFKQVGQVKKIVGLSIESNGPKAEIGEVCKIYKDMKEQVDAEVVGFTDSRILLMPYGDTKGIKNGNKVESTGNPLNIKVSEQLIGKILNGLGEPIDNSGFSANEIRFVNSPPPNPYTRKRIAAPIHLGVKAMDSLLTCGQGQRIGIFSGSGVGKSTLLGMVARNSSADINVIALVGERGREVNDFLERDLKEEGLKKSIVVVATSDQPALIRVKAALVATTIAEYFRDKNYNVLFMMDSLTRFAMAQREVGLSVGEPPVARGYTPSVFSMLPQLLERTGCSENASITALYTVLVEGDELNEPISDAVRGILDGHIVLSRELASKNHFPAIDILNSISRVMPEIIDKEHYEKAANVRNIMATYENYKDLISIGAYKAGSNKEIDIAMKNIDRINSFLKQDMNETVDGNKSIEMLKNLVV
ncbi:MAG: flagellar protein export ATPase FliI [Clostridia bacterium]|nr:flagellar protein export ATPase FliI [Clostridia bacterium]